MTIPSDLIKSLTYYVEHHSETGGFLRAVLENDLTEAIGRADLDNLLILKDIVGYIFNELPMSCWGSKEKVKAWLKAGPK